MVKYIKCPRCELNYIDSEKQEYCDVCLAELQGSKLKFADLDEDDDIEKTELCPVCGVNYMRYGEKMCDECKKNSEYDDDETLDPDHDDEWRNYLDDETEEIAIEEESLGLADELAAEFEDEFEDEEEEAESDEMSDDLDDLDFSDDDLDDLDDEDDEDDESDEDDDF